MPDDNWSDIASAPKDGRIVEGRRLHNGREIWRGQCRWGIGFIDDGYQHRQFIGWMLPDGHKAVPPPTLWREPTRTGGTITCSATAPSISTEPGTWSTGI